MSRNATAFWHRDESYTLTFEPDGKDPAIATNVGRVHGGLRGSPQVATGLLDMVEKPARLLFGGNYDRLVDVKTKYDPKTSPL